MENLFRKVFKNATFLLNNKPTTSSQRSSQIPHYFENVHRAKVSNARRIVARCKVGTVQCVVKKLSFLLDFVHN